MPSSAAQSARRETTREAARREAVTVLRLAEAIARYSAEQIGNGLSPKAAQQAAIDTAGELEAAAGKLRRLTRPDPAERRADARRALAVELAASGLSHRQIAVQVGRSKRTVWGYLRGGS
jgi:DNA-binding NarL/FixJ family response regulator